MDAEYTLSPRLLASYDRLLDKFWDQCNAAVAALVDNVGKFPIAAVVVYGSILKGIGPRSDVDILVLVRNDYKERGFDLLDMQLDLEDIVSDASVNDVPVDLHVTLARDFVDTTRDTAFKRSFCEDNAVAWEDGETLGPYLIKYT